nr:CGNR zinc finger domain-containing protein [Rhodococcus wratislaviensis]GLK33397.1 hypothetical protein GCM10017611_02390 [Rhodococcus wratislaviensis]
MQFNHDNMTGVRLAADLVNLDTGAGWSREEVEELLHKHDIRWPQVTDRVVAELRRWAERLAPVFIADSAQARCDAINAVLTEGAGPAYLTMHDGLRPHVHFAADQDTVASRVRAVTAGSLAIFTIESEGRRLGQCALDRCTMVFVDTSRNGTRRYCSTRCGNLDAVRRHRAQSRTSKQKS